MRLQKAAARTNVPNVLVTTIAQTDIAKSFLQSETEWAKVYSYFKPNNNIEVEIRYRDVRLLEDTIVGNADITKLLKNLHLAENRITIAAYQRLIDFYKADTNFTYTTNIDVVERFNNDIRLLGTNYQQKVKFQGWPKHSTNGFTIAVSNEVDLKNVNID